MVQKLRHLWGRVEIRVLVLLVCGFLLISFALAVAQLTKVSSSDASDLVSSWDDLTKKYLAFREDNHELVVPGWFLTSGQIETILKEYGLEELQKDPEWYWTFDGGTFVFEDDGPLAKQMTSGTHIVIYEDSANEELLVLSEPEKEGGEWQEEIVYKAPAYPKLEKGEDYESYLYRELSKRRIAWKVVLKSKSAVEKETAEEVALLTEEGESGELLLRMTMEEGSNHLWVSIQGPAQGLSNMEIAAHIPDGFTNRIEIFTCTNLMDSWWTLAATNLSTEGTNTVYWIHDDPEELETLFYTAGNADIDTDEDGLTDARERFVYHSDPNAGDTDGDGVGDGDEITNGTSPTNPNDPPNVNGTVFYGGQQTNIIRVLAVTDSNSWSLAYSTTITSPGPYQITNLPGSNYYVKAFRDLDNDGMLGAIEARGEASGNPVEIIAQVTGVDITLTEPDTDGDGMPDWWELRYGLNPSSGVSEALAAWWKFDEGEGTNIGNEVSAAYVGQMVNMSTSSWTSGRLGQALSFDGTDDYVRVLQSPAMLTGNQFTVSAWAWYDGPAADTYPSVIADVTNCGGSQYSGFWLGYDQYYGGVEGLFGSCGYEAPFVSMVITGRWVHLALTYDGTNGSLYADGLRVAVNTGSFEPARMAEIRIGWADDPAYAYHWKGKLDDVRVYTEALSSNQIANMHDACLDMDGDGLDNLAEYEHGTDPGGVDSDGDGLPDGWELQNGFNPLSSEGDDGAFGDPDQDGLSNFEEWTVGATPWQFDIVVILGPDDLYDEGMLRLLGSGRGIQYRSLSASRSKCGLLEYCDASVPPKYYLSEHGTWQWDRTSYPNVNHPIQLTYDYNLEYDAVSMVSTTSVTSTKKYANGVGGCTTYTWHGSSLSCPCAYPCDSYDWDIVTCAPTHVYKYQYDIEDAGQYLDCSGCFPGAGFREATCNHTLSDEYTTSMLSANAMGDLDRCGGLESLEWGAGYSNSVSAGCRTGTAATAASRSLGTNEDEIALTKIGYRFRVANLQTGQIYRLNWAECFTPEGSSTATVLRTLTTVFRGTGGDQSLESDAYVIDPPQADGVIEPVVFRLESLLPDHIEREVDDGDGDDDTRTFVINMTTNTGDIVTVTATPNPDLPEASLPSCWTLDVIEGTANGSGKLTRTIDRTQPSKTILRCSCCSGNEKITTVYVVHCTYSGFSDGALPGHAWWMLRIEPSSAVDGVLQRISPPFTWTVNADGGFFPLHEGQLHDVGWVRIPDGSGAHTATGDHDWMIPFQSLISGLTDISAWVLSPGAYDWDTRNCVYGSLRIGGDCGVNMPSFSYPDFFAPWQFADWLNAQP